VTAQTGSNPSQNSADELNEYEMVETRILSEFCKQLAIEARKT